MIVVVIVVVVTGGKQSQLLAFALGLGWSLTIPVNQKVYENWHTAPIEVVLRHYPDCHNPDCL